MKPQQQQDEHPAEQASAGSSTPGRWVRPDGRYTLLAKVLAGAALLALMVVPIVIIGKLAEKRKTEPAAPVSLDEAIAALEDGSYSQARRLAQAHREQHAERAVEDGTVDFILGAATAYEAQQTPSASRGALEEIAAQYLKVAREHGLPAEQEKECAFLLGTILHRLHRFDQAADVLKHARELDPDESSLQLLLAESLYRSPSPQLPEARAVIEEYLARADLPAADRQSGLLRRAEILYRLNEYAECRKQLEAIDWSSPLASTKAMLLGKVLLAESRVARAKQPHGIHATTKELYEAAIRAFRDVLAREASTDEARASAMYLIGRCLFEMENRRAALTQFTRTRGAYSATQEGVAAALEEADLLRELHRDGEAVEAYCWAAQSAGSPDTYYNEWIKLDDMTARLLGALQYYLKTEEFETAAKLADAYYPIIPKQRQLDLIGEVQRAWGRDLVVRSANLPDAQAAPMAADGRAHLRRAGAAFRERADLLVETRDYPDALWNGAECFLEGRDYERVVLALQDYLKYEVRRRRGQALLAYGEAQLGLGNVDEALIALIECSEFFPRDVASYRARLLSSKAYFEKGDSERAEQLLRENLAGESLTPASKEWRESLFALGKLLHIEGRQAEAIAHLEEAVTRYPNFPQAIEGRYLIAEAYRQSAAAPREKLQTETIGTARVTLNREIQQLLRAALAQYEQVLEILSRQQQQAELTPSEQAILRNVVFARAATLFDLGRYEEAIRAYSTASNRYQHEPEVLEALVQTAVCYRRLGKSTEARGTLEQAKVVLGRIKDDSDFVRTTNYTRQEWLQQIELLGSL